MARPGGRAVKRSETRVDLLKGVHEVVRELRELQWCRTGGFTLTRSLIHRIGRDAVGRSHGRMPGRRLSSRDLDVIRRVKLTVAFHRWLQRRVKAEGLGTLARALELTIQEWFRKEAKRPRWLCPSPIRYIRYLWPDGSVKEPDVRPRDGDHGASMLQAWGFEFDAFRFDGPRFRACCPWHESKLPRFGVRAQKVGGWYRRALEKGATRTVDAWQTKINGPHPNEPAFGKTVPAIGPMGQDITYWEVRRVVAEFNWNRHGRIGKVEDWDPEFFDPVIWAGPMCEPWYMERYREITKTDQRNLWKKIAMYETQLKVLDFVPPDVRAVAEAKASSR